MFPVSSCSYPSSWLHLEYVWDVCHVCEAARGKQNSAIRREHRDQHILVCCCKDALWFSRLDLGHFVLSCVGISIHFYFFTSAILLHLWPSECILCTHNLKMTSTVEWAFVDLGPNFFARTDFSLPIVQKHSFPPEQICQGENLLTTFWCFTATHFIMHIHPSFYCSCTSLT